MLLSDDGVNFSTGLSSGLFDGLGLLVPGESITATLLVKNPTADLAVIRVSVRGVSMPPAAFAAGVTLTSVDVGAATAATATFAQLQQCAAVVPSHSLGARGVLRVDFTVTVSESVSGSDAQGQAAALDFQVAMRDAAAGAFPNAGCGISDAPPSPTVPATPGIPTMPSIPAGLSRRQGLGLASTGLAPATFLLPFAAVIIVIPKLSGSLPLTVLTSSMEPGPPPGTLVIVRPIDPRDIVIGTIVTYQIRSGEPDIITHRVIEISTSTDGSRSFILKGDNNSDPDPDAAPADQGGRVVLHSFCRMGQ